jgi:hypothetical protein
VVYLLFSLIILTLNILLDLSFSSGTSEPIVRIIEEVNTDTVARIKSNNQTSRPITITNGVRQGDLLSPVLFNLIIDKIIANLP